MSDGVRVLTEREVPTTLKQYGERKPSPAAHVAAVGRRLYLMITGGEQKTAGYSLHLAGPPLGEQLARGRLEVALIGPPPDAMVAQVITYPRLVLDLGQGPLFIREVILHRTEGESLTLPVHIVSET
ncbi:MAG TPA: protease complex subunit PrcB family protein [Firmicutes bacterium]|nr:protease complex subunit PrcB family protein [Bacillota bacterium]